MGSAAGIEAVRQAIARYARLKMPVLVQGETGSGKELVARALHQQGPRARGPFVAVNAAAIAEDLVESELFGHERGAFTGAVGRRRGLFEEAHGGTLFLDELGEIPLSLQARLLRVLETSEVRRVGGEGSFPVDVRVVCATHRDLKARVAEGAFREDLMYRLDTLRIRIPPLRERRGDIAVLSDHLLARIAREIGSHRTLDDAALIRLTAHAWPGNVRELYAVLCRAAAHADGPVIRVQDLDLPKIAIDDAGAEWALPTTGVEGTTLLALWERSQRNLSRLARATGLARSTLRVRLVRAGALGARVEGSD